MAREFEAIEIVRLVLRPSRPIMRESLVLVNEASPLRGAVEGDLVASLRIHSARIEDQPSGVRPVLSSWAAVGEISDNARMECSYKGHRLPPQIISHAIWLYRRFALSLRDVKELLAERGVIVFHEAIQSWCSRFGPTYARALRRKQGRLSDIWHVDEVFVKIRGQLHYLWRAVD
jgi:hypothetical protein